MEPILRAALIVDSESSGRSQSGLVWAGLYFRLGDVSFPADGWTDSVVVVLSWWIEAMVDLASGAGTRHEVMFMEGPYSVEIEPVSDAVWRVRCVERGLRRFTRSEGLVDAGLLVQSATQGAERALDLCRSRGWWSSDADSLVSTLEQLKRDRLASELSSSTSTHEHPP
jgi:hypothetical protein